MVMRLSACFRASALAFISLLWLVTTATAAKVRVMISGGLTAAYNALVPEFERATGHKVITAYGPSMGTTVNAIPIRLERGEPADVLIMVGYALDSLAQQGHVIGARRRGVRSTRGAAAVRRIRYRRAVARQVADAPGVFRWDRHRFQGTGRRQGPDQIPRLAASAW